MEFKKPLLGMTLGELNEVTSKLSLPSYASRQMADWLYRKHIRTIDEMTNISATKRKHLSMRYEIGCQSPVETITSVDQTVKSLFAVNNNTHFVESVFIPSKERATLCVSSQVGCKMNCIFCKTGKQGFQAQLSAHEIFNQIHSAPENSDFTNVVFMGMGEPLDNLSELFKVLDILTSPYGYGWSPKRITVSTIGILPELKRFLDESSCHLAISLNSPFHEERLSLMPVEKAYPIKKIVDLIRTYDFTHQRRVSFEYILFEGINHTERHVKELSRLLNGLECRINLIRYHALPKVNLRSVDEQTMERFRVLLHQSGLLSTIRMSRGEDVNAACGMLSTIKNTIDRM